MDNNSTVKKVFNIKPVGIRKTGRPKLKQEDDVIQDIKILGMKNYSLPLVWLINSLVLNQTSQEVPNIVVERFNILGFTQDVLGSILSSETGSPDQGLLQFS
jgi:hypothetical protein